jgi:hypothetical protein
MAKKTRISNKTETGKIALAPNFIQRIRQDAETRRIAIAEAENAIYPHRTRMQKMYLNTAENGYVAACVERRKDLTLLRKIEFHTKSGVDSKAMEYFYHTNHSGHNTRKDWFDDVLNYILDAQFYGYSLVYLGDVMEWEFVNTEIIKRWLVSPDRMMVTSYEGMTTGTNFIEDERVKNFHVYTSTPSKHGTSRCGFGLFFEVSIYENLLRNILTFNGDYIEVNVAPFRQVKTFKTDEHERAELYKQAIQMASNGVAVTDPTDEILFHATGGGSGYIAFDNFEKRLEAKIAQLILGHQDAMASIAGKLGNDNEDSPAQIALRDKQTKDCEYLLKVVNTSLLPKMRSLGFNIPDDLIAVMPNDNEGTDTAMDLVGLAVQMKNAGLQMSGKYFEEMTKIPVEAMQVVQENNLSKSITNKLKNIYG